LGKEQDSYVNSVHALGSLQLLTSDYTHMLFF